MGDARDGRVHGAWGARARFEGVLASTDTTGASRGFAEGSTDLVVREVALARVGEVREDGGDALGGGSFAS